MLRQTNISEALLYFGMPNSIRKLLLYAILKFFNAVFEQSYHNIEHYKLEQGHSMSDHPMLETVPPQSLIKSYTFGLCD